MTSPTEFLAAATNVAAIANDEAMYRASINRLYYAAFHRCYEYHAALPRLGSVGGAKGRHEQLIAQLSNPDTKLPANERYKSVAIGKELRAVCAKRVVSDYQCKVSVAREDMQQSQQIVQNIFTNT